MSDAPQWLKRYYGNDFTAFNPSVVKEGKKLALVKLSRRGSTGFSGIGYVIVKMNGLHTSSEYTPLGEGIPDKATLDKMFEKLEQEDSK